MFDWHIEQFHYWMGKATPYAYDANYNVERALHHLDAAMKLRREGRV